MNARGVWQKALSPERRVELRLQRLSPGPFFGRRACTAAAAAGTGTAAAAAAAAAGVSAHAVPALANEGQGNDQLEQFAAALWMTPVEELEGFSVSGWPNREEPKPREQRQQQRQQQPPTPPPPASSAPLTGAELEAARVCVADGESERARICTVCNLRLQDEAQAVSHCAGWKHRRRRSHQAANRANGIGDTASFDAAAAPFLDKVLVVGDCHGGRALALAVGCLRSHFCGGTIHSWAVSGQRQLQGIEARLRPPARREGGSVSSGSRPRRKFSFCVFSFGEIDVRCHSAKWFCGSDGGAAGSERLASAYVVAARHTVATVGDHCVAVLLAVPPPSEEGCNNPKAPFVGSLLERASATFALNSALQAACEASGGEVLFTGVDTFAFARDAAGTLRKDCGDGHVHVQARLCAPVHRRLRWLIAQRCGFEWEPEPATESRSTFTARTGYGGGGGGG
eukprot:COSAG06_NODE_628_length_13649_cov_20.848930_12_plen_455_part_00